MDLWAQGLSSVSSGLPLPPSSSPLLTTAAPWGPVHTPRLLTSWVRISAPARLMFEALQLRRAWEPGRRPPHWAGGTEGHKDGQSWEGCRRTSPAHAQRTDTPHRHPPTPAGGTACRMRKGMGDMDPVTRGRFVTVWNLRVRFQLSLL